jgi:DNA helicase-2/ATP-dependent DNA helicase PcrA
MMLDEFIDVLLEATKYNEYLVSLGDDGLDRKANILELKSNAVQYIKESEEPTLAGFLEQISLFNDIDKLNDDNCVSLMTIHNAKGLEFDNVFIVGMEESIFPSDRNASDDDEIEEERRVAYVGITRAKKQLTLSSATQRTLYGLTKNNFQSRFINEMGSGLNYIKSNTRNTQNVKKTPTAFQSFTLQQQIAKNKAQEKVDSTPQNVVFAEGDTVLHSIFGTGTVLQVTPTGGDYMLKVDFARVGIKTIMTNYTKVKKLN